MFLEPVCENRLEPSRVLAAALVVAACRLAARKPERHSLVCIHVIEGVAERRLLAVLADVELGDIYHRPAERRLLRRHHPGIPAGADHALLQMRLAFRKVLHSGELFNLLLLEVATGERHEGREAIAKRAVLLSGLRLPFEPHDVGFRPFHLAAFLRRLWGIDRLLDLGGFGRRLLLAVGERKKPRFLILVDVATTGSPAIRYGEKTRFFLFVHEILLLFLLRNHPTVVVQLVPPRGEQLLPSGLLRLNTPIIARFYIRFRRFGLWRFDADLLCERV